MFNNIHGVFMKKIIISLLLTLLLSASSAYADAGDMMGSFSMMDGTGMLSFGFIGLFYLILVFFIFSAVFWLTYKLIVGDEKVIKKASKKAK